MIGTHLHVTNSFVSNGNAGKRWITFDLLCFRFYQAAVSMLCD